MTKRSYVQFTHLLTNNGTLTFSSKSQLFVDLFGRFLRFCHLEFDLDAIYDE